MGRQRKGERCLGPYHHKRSGRYRCVVSGPGGSTETFYFGTEREARTFQRDYETTLTCPAGPPTPTEALDQYLDGLRARGLEESTVTTTKWQLLPLVREVADVGRVTKAQVEKRIGTLTSHASKSNTLKETRRFLDFAIKKGWATKNAAAGVTVEGKIPTGKPQLTRSEARVLITHLEGDPSDAATFTLLLMMTGARKSEILKRKVRDVDVTPCFDAEGHEYAVVEIMKTKSKAGERVLRVYEPALTRLRAQVEDRAFDEYVFPGEKEGRPYANGWPNDVLERQCIAAGVSVVPPHGLRGTAASWGKEVGVIGAAISRDLGHAGQGVTDRCYVKADAGAAARAGQMGAAMAPRPPLKLVRD